MLCVLYVLYIYISIYKYIYICILYIHMYTHTYLGYFNSRVDVLKLFVLLENKK